MRNKTQLEKNLSNPELTMPLLTAADTASKKFREILWDDDLDLSAGISTLKAVTKILEESVSRIVPVEEWNEPDNQLRLEL